LVIPQPGGGYFVGYTFVEDSDHNPLDSKISLTTPVVKLSLTTPVAKLSFKNIHPKV
jgi:hypothetical protein